MKEMNSNCKDEDSDTFAMEVFDNPFDAFHPTLSDSSVKHDNNLSPCPLLTLARELRDIIYTDLIISGHVKLAQTSKAFATEFMELMGKRGICRLTTNETQPQRLTPYPKLGKRLADMIQYLDLRLVTSMHKWDRGHEEYSRDSRMEKILGDASVPRKSCHVFIEEHLPLDLPDQQYTQNRWIPVERQTIYIRPLQLLGGFRTLTIKMSCTVDFAERPWTHEHASRVEWAYQFLHMVLPAALRGSLGNPVFGGKRVPRSMVFYPRKYREALVQEGKVPTRDFVF